MVIYLCINHKSVTSLCHCFIINNHSSQSQFQPSLQQLGGVSYNQIQTILKWNPSQAYFYNALIAIVISLRIAAPICFFLTAGIFAILGAHYLSWKFLLVFVIGIGIATLARICGVTVIAILYGPDMVGVSTFAALVVTILVVIAAMYQAITFIKKLRAPPELYTTVYSL